MTDTIPFDARPPVAFRKEDVTPCRHPKYEIDGEQPHVWCALCGVELCPYWCMRQQASGYMNMTYRLHRLEELDAKFAARDARDRERRAKRHPVAEQ